MKIRPAHRHVHSPMREPSSAASAAASFVLALALAPAQYGCSDGDTPKDDTIIVSPRGVDSNAGTQSAPLRSLKQAILAAQPGQAIRLESGTYDEQSGETWGYAVPAGVSITGASAADSVLQTSTPSGSTATALATSGNLTLQNVALLGFDIAVSMTPPTNGDADRAPRLSLEHVRVVGGVFVSDVQARLNVDDADITGTTANGAVNFDGKSLHITSSSIHAGAAPYGISKRSGDLSLNDVSVDGGNYALYQLAGSSTLRGSQLTDFESIGLYFASGELDLGTATEAGNNALTGRAGVSSAFGIYVDVGAGAVTSSATSFDGVVPPAGVIRAGATELAEPGEYFITPGQSVEFFDAP
jgi:hypothetical protein